jgi:hypothetical protein
MNGWRAGPFRKPLTVFEILETPLAALLRRVGGNAFGLFLLRLARFLVLSNLSLGHGRSPAGDILLSYSIPIVIQAVS